MMHDNSDTLASWLAKLNKTIDDLSMVRSYVQAEIRGTTMEGAGSSEDHTQPDDSYNINVTPRRPSVLNDGNSGLNGNTIKKGRRSKHSTTYRQDCADAIKALGGYARLKDIAQFVSQRKKSIDRPVLNRICSAALSSNSEFIKAGVKGYWKLRK